MTALQVTVKMRPRCTAAGAILYLLRWLRHVQVVICEKSYWKAAMALTDRKSDF